MALPVVLKSGKNYITLVLDSELDFAELLQNIVAKFVESQKFFGNESFALMFDGRVLSDREKLIILDAIDEYTSVKITRIIENDVFREYAAEKQAYIEENNIDEESIDISKDNCLFFERDIHEGEKINAVNDIVVIGNVYSGAILKAGNSIIIFGMLEGQAIAGNNDKNRDAYIMARNFQPENFRIGRYLGKPIKGNNKGFNVHRKIIAKKAMVIDGEIKIKNIR